MDVAVTERGTFKRCEYQWWLTSKNGLHLTPIVSAPYLNVGSLVHKGSEYWMQNPNRAYAVHTRNAGLEMQDSVKARYKARVGANISEAEMKPFYDSIEFAVEMARNYQLRWGGPLPEHFVCVQPEQKMRVPIPGTLHTCEFCNGTGKREIEIVNIVGDCADCNGVGETFHYLNFRLDALLQRTTDGTLWIYEKKTYGQRPKIESLQHNDQFLAYLWGVREVFHDFSVAGIAYDGMWSRDRVPKGRTLEDLFLRLLLTRSEAELDLFGYHLKFEVEEMFAVQQRGIYIPNRQWQGCWDCRVQKVCDAYMRGEPTQDIIRLNYIEREDDTADDSESESDE